MGETLRRAPSRALAWILLALGASGIAAPYLAEAVGLAVAVRPVVEVVDHVVPGAVVVLVAAIGLVRPMPIALLLVCALAGVWMTGTHAPLLLQARDGTVQMEAALLHSAPGILLLVVSVAAAVASTGGGAEASGGP